MQKYRTLLISSTLIIPLIFLQGCTAVVIGGAAAGGYYVGKDKRKLATIVDDTAITTSIKSKLIGAKGISSFDIRVKVYKGVVTLSGEVPSRKIKYKIIKLSKSTEGVKKVISKLKIE